MFSRRLILGALGSISALAIAVPALAKGKRHQNGHALLGDKIKKNGKHALHKAGKVDVSVDVNSGKVVGLTATDPAKGALRVGKVKTDKKLAETEPKFILAADPGAQHAQTGGGGGYYGYWFDDGTDQWYYWFPADVVIIDQTWVVYTG